MMFKYVIMIKAIEWKYLHILFFCINYQKSITTAWIENTTPFPHRVHVYVNRTAVSQHINRIEILGMWKDLWTNTEKFFENTKGLLYQQRLKIKIRIYMPYYST